MASPLPVERKWYHWADPYRDKAAESAAEEQYIKEERDKDAKLMAKLALQRALANKVQQQTNVNMEQEAAGPSNPMPYDMRDRASQYVEEVSSQPDVVSLGSGQNVQKIMHPLTAQGMQGYGSALNQQASIAGEVGQEKANAMREAYANYQQQIGAVEKQQEGVRGQIDQQAEQRMKAIEDLDNMKIDPNRMWKNQSTPANIVTLVAGMIGGFNQSFGGARSNQAIDFIEKMINRDIIAQQNDMQNKRAALAERGNTLNFLYKKLGDMDAAKAALNAKYLTDIKQRLSMIDFSKMGKTQQAAADVLKSQMDIQIGNNLTGTKTSGYQQTFNVPKFRAQAAMAKSQEQKPLEKVPPVLQQRVWDKYQGVQHLLPLIKKLETAHINPLSKIMAYLSSNPDNSLHLAGQLKAWTGSIGRSYYAQKGVETDRDADRYLQAVQSKNWEKAAIALKSLSEIAGQIMSDAQSEAQTLRDQGYNAYGKIYDDLANADITNLTKGTRESAFEQQGLSQE